MASLTAENDRLESENARMAKHCKQYDEIISAKSKSRKDQIDLVATDMNMVTQELEQMKTTESTLLKKDKKMNEDMRDMIQYVETVTDQILGLR